MKFKKLAALITAGALCLGMGMTAFAADNSRETLNPIDAKPAGVTTSDGTKLEATALSEKQLDSVQNDLAGILENNGYEIPEGAKLTVVTAADIEEPENFDPEKGVQIEVTLTAEQRAGLYDGAELYVLHWNDKTNQWEVLKGRAVYKNGKLYTKVYDFSPFAFVKMSQINSKGEEEIFTVEATTGRVVKPVKPTSPKTGE